MKRKHLWRGLGLVVVVLVVAAAGAMAYLQRERPGVNVDSDGLALAGYDPVSYFANGGGAPTLGDARWAATSNGRRYHFSSAENRQQFLAAPERFTPQFGGWCTYAVAHGYKFEVDPTSYLIENDRLLLFYKGVFGDARSEFTKAGVAAGLGKADDNWRALAASAE